MAVKKKYSKPTLFIDLFHTVWLRVVKNKNQEISKPKILNSYTYIPWLSGRGEALSQPHVLSCV
jgi:hypothetical protein